MKHVKTQIAVFVAAGLAAAVGSAQAGFADGWDIQIQWGQNNPWSVAANPGSYTMSSRLNDQGVTIFRIVGQWQTSNWAATWDMEFDPDPFVSSSFTIQNLSGSLAPFTVTVTTPAISLPAPTSITGSISGTVGDGDGVVDQFGNGATVMTQANGRPYYEALVDGIGVRSLYTAPQTNFAAPNLTSDIDSLDYINEVGPALVSTIGIRNAFMLTPGDNASFTSTFLIVPSPAGMGVLALAGLAATRRRR